jgi:DNA repair exonuclease SbcCD ATPase subunit
MESYAADWKHYDSDIKKIETEYAERLKSIETEIQDLRAQMNNLKGTISGIDQKINIYKNNLKLINENYDDLINSYIKKREDIEKQIADSDHEIVEWNELNDLFSKTLRYKLLDTLIPHINASIQYYMSKLDQGYKVIYDQEFKAHIYTDNIDGEISYKDLSTGQKKTLDMAIIFGILQNLIANVDFNIMFLDELFANLDTDARNIMLGVLTESLANERCVFVINHAEMADDFFNHKIRVRLVNKNVTLSKKQLKKAVDTGSDKIVARATTFEIIHF